MGSISERLQKNSDLLIVVGFVGILGILIVPLPPIAIDFLMSFALALSVVLLLTSVYVQKALDFSIFPSLLLITTLFRLALNVATTRKILLNGAELGTQAAGEVIRAFGEFVIGGNYAVGLVVFAILVIINFIVITKGAGRVAEVAARFTLDAMPGKQMAIDADLNAGLIQEEEARRRRSEIGREADFYGAMDGASKFVRGDAIAGILIVFINIIGGIMIGTLQKGMDVAKAAEVFTLLTIGDGLVSQIPALIISTAAGILVTRTSAGPNYSGEFGRQLFTNPKALYATSAVMMFLAVVPGLPFFPFAILGGGLFVLSQALVKASKEEKVLAETKAAEEAKKPGNEKIESLLAVDTLELEVGYGLIKLVDPTQEGDLLARVTNIRKQFALDLGIVVPPLRIRDNLELAPGDYQILLKGMKVGSGTLMPGHFLAMDPGGVTTKISGIPTKEPAFGIDALWITDALREEATYAGYTVVDLSTVIATHLTELVRLHSPELLGRQELQVLLDSLKQTAPKVIEDLIPGLLSFAVCLKILKNLLRENVSIRDLKTILESISEVASFQKDPLQLTEHVRGALGRQITKKLAQADGELQLITLDRHIEESIAGGILQTDQGQQLSLDPEFVRSFVSELQAQAIEAAQTSGQAIILCSPVIRAHLKQLLDRFIPNIVVLSHQEISPQLKVKSLGTVRLNYAS